ncbi:type IVB secretion system protein IcmJDotN [Cysteiniphilum sp. JM-1]|uniref:type IVB secretion system protein IcmJDotN n=1 Tax=Cysteiniphilum sp. JM-1 TaxID=2610891 RepID=UPI001243ACE7|nr:type IVB secretion system protein IcmJDotN [Cysteiniphilum sp. JM-1]
MRLNELTLQNIAGSYVHFISRQTDEKYQVLRLKTLTQTSHCQYCGFSPSTKDLDSMQIVNIDGDYSHNQRSNFALACSLCANYLLLDQYPTEYVGEDRMIYLPELTQQQLQALYHAIVQNDLVNDQNEIYAELMDRAEYLEQCYGVGLSNPGIFKFLLITPHRQQHWISAVRWLPQLT